MYIFCTDDGIFFPKSFCFILKKYCCFIFNKVIACLQNVFPFPFKPEQWKLIFSFLFSSLLLFLLLKGRVETQFKTQQYFFDCVGCTSRSNLHFLGVCSSHTYIFLFFFVQVPLVQLYYQENMQIHNNCKKVVLVSATSISFNQIFWWYKW